MAEIDSGGRSILDAKVKRRLEELGPADVVIGIPSHRNGRTIGQVIEVVMRGIGLYLTGLRVVLVNADGGSSDNTMRQVKDACAPANVEKVLYVYQGTVGKGMAIRSILEVAVTLQAKACIIIEAHAPGIVPEWIPALVNPILAGGDLTMACYQRSAYGAALGDNLVYPFLYAFFNTDLREPLANEFCVSGKLATALTECDVWETDVARFGVNIWIAMQTLSEDWRISQVDLGYRGLTGCVPGTPLDARFLHTIGIMFRFLTTYRQLWQKAVSARHRASLQRHVPFEGMRCQDRAINDHDYLAALVKAMHDGRERYGGEWEKTLSPETSQAVFGLLELPLESFDFPLDLWVKVVLELAVVYNRGEGDPDKVAQSLLPLFYGRAGAYVRQTQGLTPTEREVVVNQIVQAFVNAKPFFLNKWNAYRPQLDEASTYWFR